MNRDEEEEGDAAHPEARASRRKYKAERRARILQLFGPVSLVLEESHFHRTMDSKKRDDDDDDNIAPVEESKASVKEPEDGDTSSSNEYDIEEGNGLSEEEEFKYEEDPYAEQSDFVEIPSQGVNGSETRLVPCLCIICLQQYQVGEEIVWSSNPDCEHCFHESCIERWLIKQRGGPLCPCCRRDFIIDPFDLETHDEEEGNVEQVQ